MKKRRTFFYTILAAGLLASCTNDELADNPLADGPVAAKVTAGINQALTRVSVDSEGSADFTTNDVIHVVTGNSTYEYTYNGSTWDAQTPRYYFQNTNFRSFSGNKIHRR